MKRFGLGYILFPALLIVFGWVCFSAARQLAPDTYAAASEFSSDPSCTIHFTADVTPGACRTGDVTIVSTERRRSGDTKSPTTTPYAYVRLADGTLHDVQLDGSAGDVFALDVPNGSRGRVQTFHGTIVRLTAGADATETTDAPDVNAEIVREMPWVGRISISLAILIFALRIYALRSAGT